MNVVQMRRGMGTSGGGDIPYQRVQYLGALYGMATYPYIVTNYTIRTSDVVEINATVEITDINASDNNILFGCFSTFGPSPVRLFPFARNNRRVSLGYDSVADSNYYIDNSIHRLKLNLGQGEQKVYIDGELIIDSQIVASYLPNGNFSLFGARNYSNSGRTIISPVSMNLYDFNMKINGGMVVDYYPVVDGGVGYMYDAISQQLVGTPQGTFVVGPDVQ